MKLVYVVFGSTSNDNKILAVYDTLNLAEVAAEEFRKENHWEKIVVQAWRVRNEV